MSKRAPAVSARSSLIGRGVSLENRDRRSSRLRLLGWPAWLSTASSTSFAGAPAGDAACEAAVGVAVEGIADEKVVQSAQTKPAPHMGESEACQRTRGLSAAYMRTSTDSTTTPALAEARKGLRSEPSHMPTRPVESPTTRVAAFADQWRAVIGNDGELYTPGGGEWGRTKRRVEPITDQNRSRASLLALTRIGDEVSSIRLMNASCSTRTTVPAALAKSLAPSLAAGAALTTTLEPTEPAPSLSGS